MDIWAFTKKQQISKVHFDDKRLEKKLSWLNLFLKTLKISQKSFFVEYLKSSKIKNTSKS